MNNTLYNEIVELVQKEFDFTRPTDFTDWNDLKGVDKFAMIRFACKSIKENNLATTKVIAVFDKLNIDIVDAKGRLRKNIYHHLARFGNKTIARPVPMPGTVQIPKLDRYLNNVDNSQNAKVRWLQDKIAEGVTNSKKKKGDSGRGGAFSYGPQALRNELKERFIEFAANHLPDYCPITKCKLDYGRFPKSRGYDDTSKEHQKHRASLDRHDPTIGYTFDNCRVLSKLGNTLKGNGTREEIKQLFEYMMKD
jgi:hypothetical protein